MKEIMDSIKNVFGYCNLFVLVNISIIYNIDYLFI